MEVGYIYMCVCVYVCIKSKNYHQKSVSRFLFLGHAGLQKPFYIRLARGKSKGIQVLVMQYSDGWCAGSSNTRQVAS